MRKGIQIVALWSAIVGAVTLSMPTPGEANVGRFIGHFGRTVFASQPKAIAPARLPSIYEDFIRNQDQTWTRGSYSWSASDIPEEAKFLMECTPPFLKGTLGSIFLPDREGYVSLLLHAATCGAWQAPSPPTARTSNRDSSWAPRHQFADKPNRPFGELRVRLDFIERGNHLHDDQLEPDVRDTANVPRESANKILHSDRFVPGAGLSTETRAVFQPHRGIECGETGVIAQDTVTLQPSEPRDDTGPFQPIPRALLRDREQRGMVIVSRLSHAAPDQGRSIASLMALDRG